MNSEDDLQEQLDDANARIDELEDELEGVRRCELAAIYTSIPGSERSLVARFANAEEALMCLPALSRILRTPLYLVAKTSLGMVNPIPHGCAQMNSGFIFRP